jgi:hypothetical protein
MSFRAGRMRNAVGTRISAPGPLFRLLAFQQAAGSRFAPGQVIEIGTIANAYSGLLHEGGY